VSQVGWLVRLGQFDVALFCLPCGAALVREVLVRPIDDTSQWAARACAKCGKPLAVRDAMSDEVDA
jgi:hypothetical protein